MNFRYAKSIFIYIVPFLHGFIHIARAGSVYVTMVVTIERYFAIVHPLKDFRLKRALLPIAMFFAVAYNIPKVRVHPSVFSNLKFHPKYSMI